MKMASLPTRVAQTSITAAAVAVFARLGYAATRVEDLLEGAGISRGTFYKYFQSKEDVLAAVYELATGELVRAMREATAASAEPLQAILLGLDLYLDYHVDNAPLLRVLVEQAIRSESPIAAARQRFRDELVRSIEEAVKASGGEKQDAMLYAALLSALEGLSLELLRRAPGEAKIPRAKVQRAKRVMRLLIARVLLVGRPT